VLSLPGCRYLARSFGRAVFLQGAWALMLKRCGISDVFDKRARPDFSAAQKAPCPSVALLSSHKVFARFFTVRESQRTENQAGKK